MAHQEYAGFRPYTEEQSQKAERPKNPSTREVVGFGSREPLAKKAGHESPRIPGFGRELAFRERGEKSEEENGIDITDLIPELKPVAEKISDRFCKECSVIEEHIAAIAGQIDQKVEIVNAQIMSDQGTEIYTRDKLAKEANLKETELKGRLNSVTDSFLWRARNLVLSFLSGRIEEQELVYNLSGLKSVTFKNLNFIAKAVREWELKEIPGKTEEEKTTFSE
ncbi:MAG: hypothetical protein G01um101433_36 [Parcubacteria group bacterium Gr01-1014_33]|nr:MAG: hypothetical protein G01um101433_36 [Parcubacteria group bacterium Gr01-1014_33]